MLLFEKGISRSRIMKAIVYTRYGLPDVLQLREVEKPEPGKDQVLVKVYAASANALDQGHFEKRSTTGRIIENRFFNSVGKVFRADFAGVVKAVGVTVKQFHPGDEVFGVDAGSKSGFPEYADLR
jgi:NADPH:quinone reductase-like Zn-dependent oxidoreductase